MITLRRPKMVGEYRDNHQFIAMVGEQQFGIVLQRGENWICKGLVPSHTIGKATTLYDLFDVMEAYIELTSNPRVGTVTGP